MGSEKVGDGTLLFAGETGSYNGPWVNPDDMRKLNGMMRYTQGTALDGFSVTGLAYSNQWNSTDQVPQRAITSGQLDRFGEVDPTDGGNTDRFALSARVAGPTIPDPGRPMPTRSKANSICSTTSPTFSEIPFWATSSINTMTASCSRRQCVANP